MSHVIRHIGFAAVALAAVACADDQRSPTAPPVAVAGAGTRRSYLMESDSVVPAGGDFYMSANVDTAPGSERVASFVARVHFDARQLSYVSDEAIDGVMRAVNATDTTMITVAGASATGVPDARLFVLHFRALVAIKNPTLSLELDELNTVGYESRMASVRPATAVRVNHLLR